MMIVGWNELSNWLTSEPNPILKVIAHPALRVVGLALLGFGLSMRLLLRGHEATAREGETALLQNLAKTMRGFAWVGIFLVLLGEAAETRCGEPCEIWSWLAPTLRLLAYGVICGGALGLMEDEAPYRFTSVSKGEAKDEDLAVEGPEDQRATRVGRSYWCILLGLMILALQVHDLGWTLALSFIPAAIVIQHALFLSLNKRQSLDPSTPGVRMAMVKWTGADPSTSTPNMERGFAYQQYFGPGVLVLRYGVPALLLTVTCLTWTGVFFQHWFGTQIQVLSQHDPDLPLHAAVGLGGAFTYAVLNLGQRAARADLTSWVSYTCLATLVTGPLLAILAGLFLAGNAGQDQASAYFKTLALCFIAGYAPQPLTQFLWEKVRRQLTGGEVPARLLNNLELVCIRGITMEVADRLREEGIEDAFALAYAEPYHLFRNTGYAHQRILTWMDEALLYQFLPAQLAEKLIREFGLTGAVDLGWHYLHYLGTYPQPGDNPVDEKFKGSWLDKALGWTDKSQVADLLFRIHDDPQVEMVAALYKLGPELKVKPGNVEAPKPKADR